MSEPLSFELSRPGLPGPRLPAAGVSGAPAEQPLPAALRRRRQPQLPRLSEPEIMRHYSRLASLNYSISENFYPLGSCTMKYNPVANEVAAQLPGFAYLHPYQDEATTQGALELMFELERALCAIAGVDRVTLQPAAGAHGEWSALRMIQAYHQGRGESRDQVLVPDSAHGTNPASAALCGFQVVEVKSGADGRISVADLESKLSQRVAALMLTNPNTLGLFEREILEVAEMVHATGAKLYYDGANLNALMGICRPGDMGFDAVHMNLHKTFTTPHGGGGPGAGPVGVKQEILAMGGDGLAQASEDAVLAANYLRGRLEGVLDLPHEGPCMHEFVASARNLGEHGIKALDVAKGLLERGYYAPTIYFPLIVPEAVMVEPTETESKATLDAFADTVREVVELARQDPDRLHREPVSLPVGRLDEVAAARRPVLRWQPGSNGSPEPS